MPDDYMDGQYERVNDFLENPKKYLTIDGIDCSDDEIYFCDILSFAPEFLSNDSDAVKFRKILRKKVDGIDEGEWWEWVRRENIIILVNTICAGSWVSILASISIFLRRYDDYVAENKSWLTASSRDKKKSINRLLKKSVELRSAFNDPNLPDIPNLYHFMSCGNAMFASEHHHKLNMYCRENGYKALNNESISDVLNRFEIFLEDIKQSHKGTTSKGDRYQRQLAILLLKNLHTNLFREKVKPIALIKLIINIRYKKNTLLRKYEIG